MFRSFESLPPLEPSDNIKKEINKKKIDFGVLGAVIIIAVSALFILPMIADSESITDSISISNVTIIESSNKCEAYFTLINSGNKEGFIEIEMFVWTRYTYQEGRPPRLSQPLYHVQEQYFIKANTITENMIESELVPKFSCKKPLTEIKIIKNN